MKVLHKRRKPYNVSRTWIIQQPRLKHRSEELWQENWLLIQLTFDPDLDFRFFLKNLKFFFICNRQPTWQSTSGLTRLSWWLPAPISHLHWQILVWKQRWKGKTRLLPGFCVKQVRLHDWANILLRATLGQHWPQLTQRPDISQALNAATYHCDYGSNCRIALLRW